MEQAQITILVILVATVGMFLWGRWRHDMVAAGALLACILAGLVPAEQAFEGLAHPAVITVACVLVLSKGLQSSGAVDVLARTLLPSQSGTVLAMVALTGLGAVLSAFMNNVGALALLMPVALQMARRQQLPPGRILMPLAFGTILGGMTTLIGTPPNLIVSGFRQASGADGFGMFDYTPVGLAVAALGVAFVALVGWRLVPERKQAGMEGFESGAYITEARVPAGCKAEGLTLRELELALVEADAQVLGLVRNEVRVMTPSPRRRTRAGDILMLEAEADTLSHALSSLGLKLEEAQATKEERQKEKEKEEKEKEKDKGNADPEGAAEQDDEARAKKDKKEKKDKPEVDGYDEVVLMELVILPSSELLGRTARGIQLRTRFGVNLLAVSRQGQRSFKRLRALAFRAGDLLLMQGTPELIAEFASSTGCVPLAERELRIPDKKKALTAAGIMAASVTVAALGWLPAAVAFAAGVLASMVFRTVPPRSVYNAVDWPVVVLLGALIPVADVMESTGTARLLAGLLLDGIAQGSALVALVLILVVTMTLSDLMNNAATAAVMCPIALGAANQLAVSADPFLMAVAIGGSCAFLTPIGHQNNTLILGPGGFRFGDYWRLGLPLELLVVAISVPMLLWIWPL
ncbi:SLC13 family permease [Oceanimonas sp. MB9]|uniref:SLC13 family permease n=2 Tax=Oceanimonas doudoroffii TaxID=84158 RepID=A0A233RI81_9GAMM|nr:SLC13 family permease [Oceanimonas sp. MB9]NHI00308.1 Inner membrane protein YbiR [Oceanimonas sp. MB9]OXY83096.1 SLC13 family permease [Oceanimonas doudoroffii]